MRSALNHLRPEDVPVTGVEVEVREAEHGPAADDDADSNEFARIVAIGELAGDRHHDQRPDAAGRERKARLQRGIAEQRLQEDRQQHAGWRRARSPAWS